MGKIHFKSFSEMYAYSRNRAREPKKYVEPKETEPKKTEPKKTEPKKKKKKEKKDEVLQTD